MTSLAHLRMLYGTREILEATLPYIRGDVLDFGCGNSKYKEIILRNAKSYTGIDIEPGPFVDIVGDVTDPPIEDESFDTIVSNQVIEHVRKPWKMIEHAARILRPGGTLIITGPFLVPYHAHPHDYFRYTEQGMQSLCEDVGLTIVHCTRYGGVSAVLGEMLKFTWASPYTKPPRYKRQMLSMIEKIMRRTNKLLKPKAVYASVLCIAQKP